MALRASHALTCSLQPLSNEDTIIYQPHFPDEKMQIGGSGGPRPSQQLINVSDSMLMLVTVKLITILITVVANTCVILTMHQTKFKMIYLHPHFIDEPWGGWGSCQIL